jgi:iron(III) transport system ATP-binding protein
MTTNYSPTPTPERTGAPAGGEPRIRISGLAKTYVSRRGRFAALHDIDLEVRAGEFMVLLGPSGCGKTTLLRCIAGLERPDGGSLAIDGRTVAGPDAWIPAERRNLSMVFQSYALWPHMTVARNVGYALRSLKLPKPERARRVADALSMVGLDDLGERYPGQLSGGQQQRVALARALVANEGIVLFDEPLSNLDAKVRERLRVELLELQRAIGFTAVYVTHDQGEALSLADRVAVMRMGGLMQVSAPEELYANPATAHVARFVGNVNETTGTVREVSGDRAIVESPFGVLSGRVMGTRAVAQAEEVTVAFRPEHLAPTEGSGRNTIDARVSHTIFTGSQVDHVLAVGEETLLSRWPATLRQAEGSTLTVRIPEDDVWIFPHD